MPRITANDLPTANEIADYWKMQGYDVKVSRVNTNGETIYYVEKGRQLRKTKTTNFKDHKQANKFANELHSAGIDSEIIPLDNGTFDVIIKGGQSKAEKFIGR